MFNKFKINIFKDGIKEIEGIDTWVVSWWRRYGEFRQDEEKCYQAFTSKEDAIALKESIEKAHKLIGNTYKTYVEITKSKVGI